MKSNTEKLPIETACEIIGGQSAMARELNVSNAFVHQMVTHRRPVPARLCPLIESKTGMSRKLFRPDDWSQYWPD